MKKEMKKKKIYVAIIAFFVILILGGGVAVAADPEAAASALNRIANVSVTNWPSSQNVTVTNSTPIPVTVSTAGTQKWEYKRFDGSYMPESAMNELGQQGWELYNYTKIQDFQYEILIFRRPIQ